MLKIILMALVLLMAGEAKGLTGQGILKKVDEVMNAPQDRIVSVQMVLVEKGGATKQRQVNRLKCIKKETRNG